MSEVAGRLSAQIGAYQLMKNEGGRGVLMGGVPGAPKAKVVVIGGGVAGGHDEERHDCGTRGGAEQGARRDPGPEEVRAGYYSLLS